MGKVEKGFLKDIDAALTDALFGNLTDEDRFYCGGCPVREYDEPVDVCHSKKCRIFTKMLRGLFKHIKENTEKERRLKK